VSETVPKTTRQFDDPQQEQRVRAAWIYYVEGRTQKEVSEELGINRVAVTRLLSEAKRRNEVTISINSSLGELIGLERALERKFGLERAVVAPRHSTSQDPTKLVAAAAGRYISSVLEPNMTVGLGWGRTLYTTLGFLQARPVANLKVVSLLGGISEARRYNPSEFAWQFAEYFDAEGYLVPAPALVDSPETRSTLLERCGLDQVFQMADASDIAFISCGGISTLNTSYRVGHVSEAERSSLIKAGAVGDVLYNFLDEHGKPVNHSINSRCMSFDVDRLQNIPKRVLISGGEEKIAILKASINSIKPTVLITDEQTALTLEASDAA
jgi:DNA-binding transcriptional regulator LsrR (DeoR family)